MSGTELVWHWHADAELRALSQGGCSAQNQILRYDALASIGLLAAAVVDETGNPIGYVSSNLGTREAGRERAFQVLDSCEQHEPALNLVDGQLQGVEFGGL